MLSSLTYTSYSTLKIFHASSCYHHCTLFIVIHIWCCRPSPSAVIILRPLSDDFLIIPHLWCNCSSISTTAFKISYHLHHYNLTPEIDSPAYLLHYFQPRDTSIFTPLIYPTISLPFYDLSGSDLPPSSSDLFRAARSPIYISCWCIPLFLLLCSSSPLYISLTALPSLLLYTPILSALPPIRLILSPLYPSTFHFYWIGCAFIPIFGLSWISLDQLSRIYSVFSFYWTSNFSWNNL